MSAILAASLAGAIAGMLSLMSFLRKPNRDQPLATTPGTAYILENTVTHARLLPTPATHAFSYPTLALLLSLDALEAGALDLGRGWLFGYGGTAWRLTGLRSGAYLLPDAPSTPQSTSNSKSSGSNGVNESNESNGGTGSTGALIKAKLAEVLVRQGKEGARVWAWAETGDAWMLTMPSYVGHEGINPLTVYFCYARGEGEEGVDRADGALEWVVLEIHNTFGEKHVHVLEPGVGEEQSTPGYDHTWTFLRDFHVSPFNDRAGFYTVSIALPPPPRSPRLLSSPPRPKIRILLRTASPDAAHAPVPDKLKLTATLFARRAVPFTSGHLLRALARYPFALLLSFARILYHAGILHYKKGLDVFPRPDPKPAMQGWHLPAAQETEAEERVYGGIGWQPEGALEAYSRGLTERLLARRSEELGVRIELVSGDPSAPRRTFQPSAPTQEKAVRGDADLTIHYAAPRFFTTLLLSPSPEHMLLLGRAEDLFRVNSDSLFSQVFSSTSAKPIQSTSLTQWIRTSLLPTRFLASVPNATPARHPLDADRPLVNALAICALHLMDHLEKTVFTLFRARFVPGMEPWLRWDRTADLALAEHTLPS
ncbi:hypothetical protein TRAPUB_11100 [Trametes pubescens]|uniref:Uncharacterized protein n=1 Tax=Trametes pubescens TaxID=154538 RepID=A0A1M2VXK5_TRAPU|nr:hypothetical protein TRAPUB_11100 [Trametes pubescens]